MALRSNGKRGIGFEEAQELFRYPYYLDRREDRPEQYRAIGWVNGRLYSVIYESRNGAKGEYYHFGDIVESNEGGTRALLRKPLKLNNPYPLNRLLVWQTMERTSLRILRIRGR